MPLNVAGVRVPRTPSAAVAGEDRTHRSRARTPSEKTRGAVFSPELDGDLRRHWRSPPQSAGLRGSDLEPLKPKLSLSLFLACLLAC